MRLDKYLCNALGVTKPQALAMILAGELRVNGKPCTAPETQVHESNLIERLGQALALKPFRYFMMHKPAGVICSNKDEAYPSLFTDTGIERTDGLHVVGRLDADTTGLVIVTDDGRWSFNITRPEFKCWKTYQVSLRDALSPEQAEEYQQRLAQGLILQNQPKPTRPAKFEVINDSTVSLSIVEGKFHQVKQMFAALGNRVVGLHRTQIGSVILDIEAGQWRALTEQEVAGLQASSSD